MQINLTKRKKIKISHLIDQPMPKLSRQTHPSEATCLPASSLSLVSTREASPPTYASFGFGFPQSRELIHYRIPKLRRPPGSRIVALINGKIEITRYF